MMRTTKKTRYIPDGYKVIRDAGLGIFYSPEDPLIVLAYKGKQSRPIFHLRFRSEDERDNHLQEYVDRWQEREDSKKRWQDEKKATVEAIKVGDLFVSCWGYEQTNVDYYQCIARKGKSFTVRPIAKTHEGGAPCGDMSSYVRPVKDEFVGEPMKKFSLSLNTFSALSPVDWNDKRICTWYH